MSSPALETSESVATDLLDGYRVMRTIREFEEHVSRSFALGDVPGFVHLYAGQEAIAAAVCSQLRKDDYIGSTHRGHGHAIAKGCDVAGMMAEIFGRGTGLCKGKGGSMHIADLDHGVLGANGIVGGGLPMIVGAGLSAKVRGTDQAAVGFMGEGATNEGTFAESLNLAAVWNAPCVFVVENNGYAESTGAGFALNGVDPVRRADGYGIPGVQVDGNDFFAVRGAAAEAIERARGGAGPTLLECKTSRFYGHFEGDTQTYRAPDEIDMLKRDHDPLVRFRDAVAGRVATEQLDQIDDEVRAVVEAASKAAKDAPPPASAELLTDVYKS
jgi:acetoin:2,6-dichlorophenolindophenol oxidoreductase subunit alpha